MTYQNCDKAWFLAQLKPNSVKIADRNLCRQGFRTFLPMEEVTQRSQSKFAVVRRPLFPGYIFVSFDITKGGWRAVNSTNGVTRLVSFGKEPAPVPQDIISQLFLRCDASGKLLPPNILKPNDQVRITSGPFADFVATVDKVAPDQRVWLLMEFMGTRRCVEVNTNYMQRL